MATNIIATNIMVCSDCLDAIEYSGDDELGYTPGTLFAQMKKILAVWPEASTARFVSDGSEPDHYSTSSCEGCRSYLHGARFPYNLIGPTN